MAMIYFAHPIDAVTGTDHPISNSKISSDVHSVAQFYPSVALFDPAQAWTATRPLPPDIQTANEAVIRQADCLLVWLPSWQSSRGVPAEIQLALHLDIPIVLLTDAQFGVGSAYDSYVLNQDTVTHYVVEPTDVYGQVSGALIAAMELAAEHADVKRCGTPVAKFTGGDGQLTKAHPGDAGFDLAYNGTKPLTIGLHQQVAVPTGVRIELPYTHYAIITGRSSTFTKRQLLVPMSVIDNGFRGELFAVCWNFGGAVQTINPGERIAQLIPMRLESESIRWQRGQLSDSTRGENGFGSTGR